MATKESVVTIVGGGLAGSEAAWQVASSGSKVRLFEMRPVRATPAHVTAELAELVCSNSLGSDVPDRAAGILKTEMRRLDSLILRCADESRVPAGGALAVARDVFSAKVTEAIARHPLIELVREEVVVVPNGPTIIATGPLTSTDLAESLMQELGDQYLYFYDALSPIVTRESINLDVAFESSRYGRGESAQGDYINCPFSQDEYSRFVEALVTADQIQLRGFEQEDPQFFEGCLPVEEMARRGENALAFGPMRPVGLRDPRTGNRPFAVLQLRQDDLAGSLYNLVGFQTNLKWGEQQRVFRMIPGLAEANFVRYGQMHRNTFINSPKLLLPTMQLRKRPDLFFAGQITGIEGYVGNAASGLIAGLNMARLIRNEPLVEFPAETMIGALAHYVSHSDPDHFQPMKANLGIMPQPDSRIGKRERGGWYAERSRQALELVLNATLSEAT